MQLINDKNEIRWNQTGQLITDPTLDFLIKDLMFSFQTRNLANRYKICDLKGLKNRNPVGFLKVKLFVDNLRQGKKTVFFKNKRSHNVETLKWINTKWGTLSQTSLMRFIKRQNY